MIRKNLHILVLAFLVLILIGIVACLWPLVSHGSKPSREFFDAHPHRLTLLTWNTHQMGQFQKPEKNEVLRYLTQQDADIICLQEVDVYKTDEFLTLSEVRETLGRKYPYSYIDFAVYNKRRQFGNMVWSRYPLINKHTVEYEIRANLSSRCDVVVNASDTLRLIVNHLESNRLDKNDTTAESIGRKWGKASLRRHAQSQVVRHEIDRSPYPVIVVGDFNDIALSPTYFIIRRGLHDAWLETSWFAWGATCEKWGMGLRIDYILSSQSLTPIECSVPQTTGSDHRPVVATLAW